MTTVKIILSMMLMTLLIASNCLGDSAAMYAFDTREKTQRFNAFLKEIRCVVCQNQSLADSHAPLAVDLRYKIYQMMQNQKTEQEIKMYLVKRYGEFILFNPPFNHLTLLLWTFPFIALIAGLFFLWRYFFIS